MALSSYYTSAGSNTALFPESMAPSGVNDGMRQVQADIAQFSRDNAWVQLGNGSGPGTITWVSSTSFRIGGADVTAEFHPGRRLKITGSTTGTCYAVVASSSFSTDTTVVITDATVALANETLTVWTGMVPAENSPLPYVYSPVVAASWPSLSGLSGTGDIRQDPVYGYNAGGTRVEYARRVISSTDDTAAAEAATGSEAVRVNGTMTTELTWGGGVQIGAPTGGAQGIGSLNLAGHVFVNGVKVSDAASTTAKGVVELATAAEVLTGADNSRAVTPLGLASLSVLNATQGQFEFPGGLVLKYGTAAIASNPTVVTFDEAFTITCVSVVVTPISTTGVYRAAMITAQSTSSFSVEKFSDAGAASSVAFNWLAVGY